MARLNEPAVHTETIDSLKRKFMRQNRDIARVNSTQSLRIRNLENEASKLLAENLDLREQIIRLQNKLENGKSQRVADQTTAIKSQLESKLVELKALIIDLGGPGPVEKPAGSHKITKDDPKSSSDQKNWRNMCTLSEAVAEQEGRLPPIIENKTYPRRTLERQEIIDLVADSAVDTTDSPEIEAPPVSQFVDEDPVKIDLPARTVTNHKEELSGLDPTLSMHLEQRRKRRESLGALDSKRPSRFEPPKGSSEAPGSLKTAAKRKLSVREDEEAANKTNETCPDDFKFTRVTNESKVRTQSTSQPERTAKVTRDLAVARGAPRDKPSGTSAASATRKALAPRSINDSPRKGAKTPINDDIKAVKEGNSKPKASKEPARQRREEVPPVRPLDELAVSTVEIQPEPETPAAPELLSPSSSQPSTSRAESRDTPPPPDLGPGNEGQRLSRRARGSVSYAEPNLRDKMRRPTKEMVDAVTREAKAHHPSFIKVDYGETSDPIKIKMEQEPDEAWKRMPDASLATVENSPLGGKGTASETLPSSITTHRKRRESLSQQSDTDPRSASANVMDNLLSEKQRAKVAANEKESESEEASNDVMARLDIYEFRGSSPAPPEEAPAKSVEGKVSSRFSRRHSSIPHDIVPMDDHETSDVERSTKLDGPRTRRRQSQVDLRSSATSAESGKDSNLARSLNRSSSVIGLADAAADGSRSERISARRRSMML